MSPDEAKTFSRVLSERENMRLLLAEMQEYLQDRSDITWSGGPNAEMRMANVFGSRIEAFVVKTRDEARARAEAKDLHAAELADEAEKLRTAPRDGE